MTDNVYAITELVGSSSESIEKAIQSALETASKTLRNLDWFEVTDTRGHIKNGKLEYFQVTLKLGFRYERAAA
jgi:flavin-binding protein dodecin